MSVASHHLRRKIAVFLAAVFIGQNVVLASQTQVNLWSERKLPLRKPLAAPLHFDFTGHGTSTVPEWARKAILPFASLQSVHPSKQPNAKTVFLMEDVHHHFEAQMSIANTLDRLGTALEANRSKLVVGLEGAASGPIDLSAYRSIADKDAIRQVARGLLKSHVLSGAEFAAIGYLGRTLPFDVVGVENQNHYDANVKALRDGFELRGVVLPWLDRVEAKLNDLKTKTFNTDLAELDKLKTQYEKGTLTLIDFVAALDQRRKAEHPSVRLLLEAAQLEKNLNFSAVERNRNDFFKALLPRLTEQRAAQITEASLSLKAGQLSAADYHGFLRNVAAEHKMNMTAYADLNAYLDYVIKTDSIDESALLDQIVPYSEAVQNDLIKTANEKEIADVAGDLHVMRKLTMNQLTEPEWRHAQNRRRALATIPSRLEKLGVDASFTENRWPETVRVLENFYRSAMARNSVIASEMTSALTKSDASVGFLVVGGFHSDAIRSELISRNFNVVVLLPRVTKLDHKTTSIDLLVSQPLPLDQLFTGDKLFLTTPVQLARPELATVVNGCAQVVQKLKQEGGKSEAVVAVQVQDPETNDTLNFAAHHGYDTPRDSKDPALAVPLLDGQSAGDSRASKKDLRNVVIVVTRGVKVSWRFVIEKILLAVAPILALYRKTKIEWTKTEPYIDTVAWTRSGVYFANLFEEQAEAALKSRQVIMSAMQMKGVFTGLALLAGRSSKGRDIVEALMGNFRRHFRMKFKGEGTIESVYTRSKDSHMLPESPVEHWAHREMDQWESMLRIALMLNQETRANVVEEKFLYHLNQYKVMDSERTTPVPDEWLYSVRLIAMFLLVNPLLLPTLEKMKKVDPLLIEAALEINIGVHPEDTVANFVHEKISVSAQLNSAPKSFFQFLRLWFAGFFKPRQPSSSLGPIAIGAYFGNEDKILGRITTALLTDRPHVYLHLLVQRLNSIRNGYHSKDSYLLDNQPDLDDVVKESIAQIIAIADQITPYRILIRLHSSFVVGIDLVSRFLDVFVFLNPWKYLSKSVRRSIRNVLRARLAFAAPVIERVKQIFYAWENNLFPDFADRFGAQLNAAIHPLFGLTGQICDAVFDAAGMEKNIRGLDEDQKVLNDELSEVLKRYFSLKKGTRLEVVHYNSSDRLFDLEDGLEWDKENLAFIQKVLDSAGRPMYRIVVPSRTLNTIRSEAKRLTRNNRLNTRNRITESGIYETEKEIERLAIRVLLIREIARGIFGIPDKKLEDLGIADEKNVIAKILEDAETEGLDSARRRRTFLNGSDSVMGELARAFPHYVEIDEKSQDVDLDAKTKLATFSLHSFKKHVPREDGEDLISFAQLREAELAIGERYFPVFQLLQKRFGFKNQIPLGYSASDIMAFTEGGLLPAADFRALLRKPIGSENTLETILQLMNRPDMERYYDGLTGRVAKMEEEQAPLFIHPSATLPQIARTLTVLLQGKDPDFQAQLMLGMTKSQFQARLEKALTSNNEVEKKAARQILQLADPKFSGKKNRVRWTAPTNEADARKLAQTAVDPDAFVRLLQRYAAAKQLKLEDMARLSILTSQPLEINLRDATLKAWISHLALSIIVAVDLPIIGVHGLIEVDQVVFIQA